MDSTIYTTILDSVTQGVIALLRDGLVTYFFLLSTVGASAGWVLGPPARARPCAASCVPSFVTWVPPSYSSPLAAASRFFLAGAGGRVVSMSTSALILSGSSQ